MIITLQHLKSIPTTNGRHGYCNKTSRPTFKRYGLDWNEFRKNGLPEEDFLATGNAMAIALVEHARGQ